jgi:hypothetical protein
MRIEQHVAWKKKTHNHSTPYPYNDNRANNRGFGYARLIPLNQSAPTGTVTVLVSYLLCTLGSAEGQVHADCLLHGDDLPRAQ